MTKRDKKILVSAFKKYSESNISEIENAYRTEPSHAKICAFREIWYYMLKIHGHDLRVINASCFTFTCGFIVSRGGENVFVYFLPSRSLEASFSDLQKFSDELK